MTRPDAGLGHPRVYCVARASRPPRLADDWDDPIWRDAAPAVIDQFHRTSRGERPRAEAKLLYDATALYLQYRVRERHAVSRCLQRQGPVSNDSCVELFAQPVPGPGQGYFNFEVNCGGTLLTHYQRAGWAGRNRVADAWLDRIGVYHTMPRRVALPCPDLVTWRVALRIPLALMAAYVGPIEREQWRPAPGVRWRANWYKCGFYGRGRGHWASWSSIGRRRDFHQPARFGTLVFE